jgi:hypothetical protein
MIVFEQIKMNGIWILLGSFLLLSVKVRAQDSTLHAVFRDPNTPIERRIDNLLSLMPPLMIGRSSGDVRWEKSLAITP